MNRLVITHHWPVDKLAFDSRFKCWKFAVDGGAAFRGNLGARGSFHAVAIPSSQVVGVGDAIGADSNQPGNLSLASWRTGGSSRFDSTPKSSGGAQSIVSDMQLRDEYDWSQWTNAFKHRGSWHTVAIFSLAECLLNAMSALLGKFLRVAHFFKTEIGVVGASFIMSSLIGGQVVSQVISHYVDTKRNHKTTLQICLLMTVVALVAFRLVPKVEIDATLVSLLLLEAVLGPIQPIVLELGVECAFPASEVTVAALQQLCGIFLSAIMVPCLSMLRRTHVDSSGHVPPRYFDTSPKWIRVFIYSGVCRILLLVSFPIWGALTSRTLTDSFLQQWKV
ncbi:unnamed protein product [Phytophthora fragariaefolia]|uniref:Unnamed protein product n=1 Tax=Phytophthora fragariaefolia TaxID=1490495 RepID=A0A9W7CKL7_9STRA|nr:unnamed protein product [Phytophthora fragariaefolia]